MLENFFGTLKTTTKHNSAYINFASMELCQAKVSHSMILILTGLNWKDATAQEFDTERTSAIMVHFLNT